MFACLHTLVFVCGQSLLQVPKSIPAWQAAFIEPLACSIHAVELGSVGFRDTVVVAGCGPLGLGMVAAARLKNPANLIALDLYDWKVSHSPYVLLHTVIAYVVVASILLIA